MSEAAWRCFHCGFETSDRSEAMGHFGEFGEEKPLCIVWAELDADGKASEFQSINSQLEQEREENLKLRQRVEQLEHSTASQEAEISSRFKGCTTINEAFFKYDTMEGRALAAEAKLAKVREALRYGWVEAREALDENATPSPQRPPRTTLAQMRKKLEHWRQGKADWLVYLAFAGLQHWERQEVFKDKEATLGDDPLTEREDGNSFVQSQTTADTQTIDGKGEQQS